MDTDTNYPIQKHQNFRKHFLIGTVILLLAGAVGTAAFFYQKYTDLKLDPAQIASRENSETVAAVSKIMFLPEDEQPTIATVTDPSKLGSQAFFARAKVGDKVLLYAKAKKAILYDPAANKIIEVAPIDLDDENAPDVSGANSGGGIE